MTKKHFVAIAEAFANSKPVDVDGASETAGYHWRLYQWGKDVLAMASVLATTNPNFNRQPFLNACGMEN